MPPLENPYIFCIGYNKCGTSALHAFFEANGIASVHWDGGLLARTMLSNAVEGRKVFDGYDQDYRAFSDMFFFNDRIAIEGIEFFRLMDRDYPNSLFVYNTRDMQAWLQSRRNHASKAAGSLLQRYLAILNTTSETIVLDHWAERRLRFEAALATYFAGSPRLLTLDIDAEDVPVRLADFLSLEPNAAAWTRVNATARPT